MYSGTVTVSDEGAYLRTMQDFIPWDWPMIHSAQMVGFNQGVLAVPRADGRLGHWLLQSHYAELVFVLWAAKIYPSHPAAPGRQLAARQVAPLGSRAGTHACHRGMTVPPVLLRPTRDSLPRRDTSSGRLEDRVCVPGQELPVRPVGSSVGEVDDASGVRVEFLAVVPLPP